MIAPAHGLIWRGNPGVIVNRFVRYCGYQKDYAEPEVAVVYGSMYGNTEKMVKAVCEGISRLVMFLLNYFLRKKRGC